MSLCNIHKKWKVILGKTQDLQLAPDYLGVVGNPPDQRTPHFLVPEFLGRSPIDRNVVPIPIKNLTPYKFPQIYSFSPFLSLFACHLGHTQVDACWEVFVVPSVKTNISHLKINGWKMKCPWGPAYFQVLAAHCRNYTLPKSNISPMKIGWAPNGN